MKNLTTTKFIVPPKRSLSANNESDPLKYYYVPLVSTLFIKRINITIGLLRDKQFGKVLEIGYGSGILMPTLCKMSDQVYGVDIGSDPELVAELLRELGCAPQLSRGEPSRLLFEDNSFDLVIAISVLEHIKDIRAFLEEIHRVVRPGGYLLVGMPAVNKLMDYLFQAIGFSNIDDHHVTSPEDMHRSSRGLFTLRSTARLPGFLLPGMYLYKSFLFQK